jgi:hypothetical protein
MAIIYATYIKIKNAASLDFWLHIILILSGDYISK